MKREYLILAIRNLRKRKLRSWLTIIGIIISIATIFMLISISLGLQDAIEEQFRLIGTDKFFIQSKGQAGGPGTSGAVELTIKDVEAIERVSGVKAVSYATIASVKIESDGKIRYTSAIGFPSDKSEVFEEISAYRSDEGKLLGGSNLGRIMVGSQFKYNNFFDNPIRAGDKITINDQSFKVQTILQSIGNSEDDKLVYMNIEDLRIISKIGERIDQIIVQVDQGQDLNEVAEKVDKKLRTSRGLTEKTKDFIVLTPEELLGSFDIILNIITSFLTGIAAISLLVGGIGIMNTMYTSVLERTREIGVMKAVGAKNSDILYIFLFEAGLLGAIGGFFGVLLGYCGAKLIELIAINKLETTLLQAAAPAYLIIGCLLFAFISGAVSGIWPAWRASKTKVVDALRYE